MVLTAHGPQTIGQHLEELALATEPAVLGRMSVATRMRRRVVCLTVRSRLRPSIGRIAWPWNLAGYFAPASSTHVAIISTRWPGCWRSSPRAAMPAGQ